MIPHHPLQPLSIIEPGVPLWPADYNLPEDHCADVARGSYDIPFDPKTPPVVIDIGANCGMFTRWAAQRWPGCTIHAYEPEAGNYALLGRTIASMAVGEYKKGNVLNVSSRQQAVAGHNTRALLHRGQFNCGEWSLLMDAGLGSVEVDVISAADLPRADILKIDAEGAEASILATLHQAGRIGEFSAIMLETHNPTWVAPIKLRMADAGFTLTGETQPYPNRSELKFVKTSLLSYPL